MNTLAATFYSNIITLFIQILCSREPNDTLRALLRVPDGVALAPWQQDVLDHERLLKDHIGDKLQYEAASSLRQLVTSFMEELASLAYDAFLSQMKTSSHGCVASGMNTCWEYLRLRYWMW